MKKRLIEEMRTRRELSEAEAGRSIDDVFGALDSALEQGDRIAIQGFGTFSRQFREGRTARNPRTGEPVSIAGRKVTKFKEARQRDR